MTVSPGDVSEVSTFHHQRGTDLLIIPRPELGSKPSSATTRPSDQIELQPEQNRIFGSLPGAMATRPERWKNLAPWNFEEGGAGPRGRGARFRVCGSKQNLPALSPCRFPGAPHDGLLGPVSEQRIPGSQL